MENYIMINGTKIELTPKQIKLIKKSEQKSPFDRVEEGETYYYFNHSFDVYDTGEDHLIYDDECYNSANYCTDKNIMEQHALHMQLNNLLWRYSMVHGGDKIDWHNDDAPKFYIINNGNMNNHIISVCSFSAKVDGLVYFIDAETADAAIEEVLKPFIKAHPDFDRAKM